MLEIPASDCIDLLRRHDVGRVCVVCDGVPIALPTSYRLLSDAHAVSVVMRTRPDGVVSRSLGVASFEVDQIDVTRGEAWSVLARGELRLLDAQPGDLVLQPWATGRSVWVALVVGAITGRRIRKDEAFEPTGPRSGFEVDWAV